MNLQEYEKVKGLTYLEYCDYLQDKYGIGQYNYMTKNWNKVAKSSRTSEGLVAHHKCENKAILLSNKAHAMQHPYEWQKKQNIVYCDCLEHLFLHVLITEIPLDEKDGRNDLGIGGIIAYIVPELNDLYSGWKTKQGWRKNWHDKVISDKDAYLEIIKRIVHIPNIAGNVYEAQENLCNSFNSEYGLWSSTKNRKLYQEIISICKQEWEDYPELTRFPNHLKPNRYGCLFAAVFFVFWTIFQIISVAIR